VRRALVLFMPVNRAAQLRRATKVLTVLQQNDSPISSDFRRRTPPGKAFRNPMQHSTKMLTVNPRPQNHSPSAGKLLTLAMDFSSLSVHKSPHLKHKITHLHGAIPLFSRVFAFPCCWFVGFCFSKDFEKHTTVTLDPLPLESRKVSRFVEWTCA